MPKQVLIDFNWRGYKVTQFIPTSAVAYGFNNFIGEFVYGTNAFNYVVSLDGVIKIYKVDSTDVIDIVDSFNLTFSKNY